MLLAAAPRQQPDSAGPPRCAFGDNQAQFLIPDINDAYGVCFRDINGDRRPDIYLVCYRAFNRLLLNSGGGVYFYDATVESGLGGDPMPMGAQNLELGAVSADFDNDGDADLVIAGWGRTTRLYSNEGGLVFQDVSGRLNIPSHLYINGVITADVNLDGFLDLFFTDERLTNRLLLNDHKGGFTDRTRESGLVATSSSRGAAFSDVDLDGDPDLFVANLYGPDFFYRNDGGYFSRQTLDLAVCRDSLSSQSCCFGDVDNDGDPDLFVARIETPNQLYVNETAPGDSVWSFSPSPLPPSPKGNGSSNGCLMADFNQDGLLDIWVTNDGPNQLLVNTGSGIFIPSVYGPNPGNSYSTGAAVADYDDDGDLYLFTSNLDGFCLFSENVINDSRSLRLRVEGVRSNRDGIGCRIEFFRSGSSFRRESLLASREIQGGSGLYSMSDPVVHLGLGQTALVDCRVIFPSGRRVEMTGLKAGGLYRISEYIGPTRQMLLLLSRIRRVITHQNFWQGLLLVIAFPLIFIGLVRLGLKRYLWTTRTVTAVLALLFILAASAILLRGSAGLVSLFLFIDGTSLVLGGILSLHFERTLRLRQLRERYRSVLLKLSNRIVQIREAELLLKTVIDHITEYTEFDCPAALLFDRESERFSAQYCPAGYLDMKKLNTKKVRERLIKLLTQKSYLSGGKVDLPLSDPAVRISFLAALKRGDNFFGLIILASCHPVEPLHRDDIGLYHSIANQMAVAAENIEYIRASNEMIKKLTEASVREKYLEELENKNRSLDDKNKQLQLLYDELKQTESQLIQSEKMASLGQLVAGIAHELNNPIGFIYGNMKQLRSYIDRVESFLQKNAKGEKSLAGILPDLNGLIEDTLKGSQAVKELVENLRTFSHLDQAERKPADIHPGIETCLMILRPEIKDRIRIETSLETTRQVECNAGQLNQVFLNIILNAAQAIPDLGTIFIRTRDRGDTVVIEIEDTGSGIPEEIQDKIFDPFYTTKEVGHGMGLGLSISYSIIQNHGGKIEVESRKGKGSLFRITLPVKSKQPVKK